MELNIQLRYPNGVPFRVRSYSFQDSPLSWIMNRLHRPGEVTGALWVTSGTQFVGCVVNVWTLTESSINLKALYSSRELASEV